MVSDALTIFYPLPVQPAARQEPQVEIHEGDSVMANGLKSAQFLMQSRFAGAEGQTAEACFDLGVAYSCGTGGLPVDLIEAHKWFNLAALKGSEEGQAMRAEVAEEMSAREIAEAQRQARTLIATTQLRAA
jgi:TPR repeat protein